MVFYSVKTLFLRKCKVSLFNIYLNIKTFFKKKTVHLFGFYFAGITSQA